MITCEVCGGTELLKQDGVFTCKGCGCQYTIEEVRKMMGNDTGSTVASPTVSPANAAPVSSELENLYQIARRAKNDNNSENAAKYYEMIMIKDPSSWEAAFYQVYFTAMSCKIAQIQSAANSVENCEESVLSLVKDYVADVEEQRSAVEEIEKHCEIIATMLYNGAKNHYDGIDSSIKSNYTNEVINNCLAARNIMFSCGNYINSIFSDKPEIASVAEKAWKAGMYLHAKLEQSYLVYTARYTDELLMYAEKIGQYDPAYEKDYVYNKKKEQLEGEIASLKFQITSTSNQNTSTGCGAVFAGIICLFCGILYMAIGEDVFEGGTILGVVFLVIGAIALWAGLGGNKAGKAQEEKEQKINDLQMKLKQKEEELSKLQR